MNLLRGQIHLALRSLPEERTASPFSDWRAGACRRDGHLWLQLLSRVTWGNDLPPFYVPGVMR